MEAAILSLIKIRDLTLEQPAASGRPSHLSAASGLVAMNSLLYVIADDEHHLGVFSAKGQAPGKLIRLLDGDLPDDKARRKRLKPDLETLVWLPPFSAYAHGALFAVGSGSTPNRKRAVLLSLDEHAHVNGAPRVIDLSQWLAAISESVRDLNIEGAVIVGDQLILLQRGNRGDGINGLIATALSPLLQALTTGDAVPEMPFDVRRCDLGSIDGIPLTFTDAAALPDGGVVFSAVAEDTVSSYADGACAGAVVGVLNKDGRWRSVERLHPGVKVEGIAAQADGDRVRLLLVTDADDVNVPGSLYAASIAK